ncbi:MAG TPA: BamA/TamA family outer membrane protein [Polyangia bacterium]|nr:BamA/TamA family outer membrane protein [Polyangia bacterium]
MGGDSDVGIGGGVVGDLAALAPGRPPFRWRLELEAFITFKLQDGDQVVSPFQDYSLELVVPYLDSARRLRLDARLSFTDEATLNYTGIGNASPPLASALPVTAEQYERLHPTASLEVRERVAGTFYLLGGTSLTYNRLTVPAGTILEQQQRAGPPEVRALLGSFAPHGVELLTAELQYDTRDDEIVTENGQFHTLRFRYSPRLGSDFPYAYQRLTLTGRFYRSTVGGWLTLRARVVGDVLFGSPPFYELARFDETPAIGGSKAVRGVPAQRYYGGVKVFENLELSAALWTLTVHGKRLTVGPAVFADAGRSWTEIGHAHPELDGTGLGLKYGLGGGLRVQEGKTFLVRLDLAWSPDATPIGAYFAAGEIF